MTTTARYPTMSLFFVFSILASLISAHAIHRTNAPINVRPRQAAAPRAGSYIMTYQPSEPNSPLYKGPLRISSDDSGTIISGDLYNGTVEPNPADGSPILPRTNYFGYVRATSISSSADNGFTMGLEMFRYLGWIKRRTSNETQWDEQAPGWGGGYTVTLTPTPAPSGYPDTQNYFSGEVKFASNASVAGHMTLGWVSTYLRRYTLEIGTEAGQAIPLTDTSSTRSWETVFRDVGWDLKIEIGKTDIPAPSTNGGNWTAEELQTATVQYRNPATDLDREWRSYLLLVRKAVGVPRGWVFDSDSAWNQTPREGVVVVSDAYVNEDGQAWPDSVAGKRIKDFPDVHYRIALHEVGHLFNLPHPGEFDNSVMVDTPTFMFAGKEGVTREEFPENITPGSLRFSERDSVYVRHYSDVHVRPGFAEWGIIDQRPPHAEPI